jgi:hypothetical protein
MAYVNEPPIGAGGTNVYCTNGAHEYELLYVATKTILPGDEIFVDYGLRYDRSHYDVLSQPGSEAFVEPSKNDAERSESKSKDKLDG